MSRVQAASVPVPGASAVRLSVTCSSVSSDTSGDQVNWCSLNCWCQTKGDKKSDTHTESLPSESLWSSRRTESQIIIQNKLKLGCDDDKIQVIWKSTTERTDSLVGLPYQSDGVWGRCRNKGRCMYSQVWPIYSRYWPGITNGQGGVQLAGVGPPESALHYAGNITGSPGPEPTTPPTPAQFLFYQITIVPVTESEPWTTVIPQWLPIISEWSMDWEVPSYLIPTTENSKMYRWDPVLFLFDKPEMWNP